MWNVVWSPPPLATLSGQKLPTDTRFLRRWEVYQRGWEEDAKAKRKKSMTYDHLVSGCAVQTRPDLWATFKSTCNRVGFDFLFQENQIKDFPPINSLYSTTVVARRDFFWL